MVIDCILNIIARVEMASLRNYLHVADKNMLV
jgi:hypothetical protein